MGKAQILENLGEGLYRVNLVHDVARAQAEIPGMEAENVAIDARLATIDDEINEAYLAVGTAKEVLSAAIYALKQAEGEEDILAAGQKVEEATSALRGAEKLLSDLRALKASMKLRKTANLKRIELLTAECPETAEAQAWCADYADNLSGEVGTIETARLSKDDAGGTPPIIRPAGETGDGAAYDAVRDGQLRPIWSQTPAQALLNHILTAGASKWKPRCRLGEITSLDSDLGLADVLLDDLEVTPQALEGNQAAVLADVPIQYMDCHAEAFQVGDRVVVE
ncbi:hypothetical protein, partial [Desulfuromonas sp. TF]|uniref:hypothetical protein n=1 Tax=Desulfuromonas sp. TF TaxID=1232410 RepID=UPI000483187F